MAKRKSVAIKTELFAFSKLKGKVIGAYVGGQEAGLPAATLS